MILAILAAAALTPTAEDAAGRYSAEAGEAACSITLRPAAARLPESNLEGETVSGFAFAAPDCQAGLSRAAFWRLSLTEGRLRLVDGSGETLFEGRLEAPVWTGQTPDGEPVTLRPR